MTAVFDWSGAPEGERWVTRSEYEHEVRWVITEGGQVYGWLPFTDEWKLFSNRPDRIRANGTRVESARPVPRVGDRVRVTVEGVVQSIDRDQIDYTDDHGVAGFVSRRPSAAVVEVLQRADPPLQPGDLVRDGRGYVYEYLPIDLEDDPADTMPFVGRLGGADVGTRFSRSELTGPLVKVQLTEVPDA